MISHIVRTRYKLGTVLAQHGEVEEAGQFLALARAGREALTGKPGDVDDSIEYYDSMVPYWAW